MQKNALMLGLAAFTFVGSCSIAQAADGAEYVYVESNTSAPNSNSIYAFRRGSTGSLTPLPGSPFLTGGAGVQYTGSNLGPFDSDSEVIVNPDQTLLFAVNAGSDSVAATSPALPLLLPNYTTLRVGSNGTLIPFGSTTMTPHTPCKIL